MLSKSVALITGANRGLGLEIARQLGQKGSTVLIAARDFAKAEDAAAGLRTENLDARAVELDVTNSEHITSIAKWIEQEYGKLDILINNAGVSLDRLGRNIDTLRKTFDVNVFAVYELTEALLPLLKASPNGRIVNQSSILGSITSVLANSERLGNLPAYSSSKTALNMLTVTWSIALKDTNVKVNATHPGWVRTDMGTEKADLSIPEGAKTAVWLATLPADGPTGGYFHKDQVLPW